MCLQGLECVVLTGGPHGFLLEWRFSSQKSPDKESVYTHRLHRNLNCRAVPRSTQPSSAAQIGV